jgi:hypothetical protein
LLEVHERSFILSLQYQSHPAIFWMLLVASPKSLTSISFSLTTYYQFLDIF